MNQIFISYSHKDKKWKDQVASHLRGLEKQDLGKVWVDRKIQVGDQWNDEIDKALQASAIAVLLISARFLGSDFIIDTEIPRILELREQQGLRIIPVIVSPCDWNGFSWLSNTQAHTLDGAALSGGSEHEIEDALTLLTQKIRSILQELRLEETVPVPAETDPQDESQSFDGTQNTNVGRYFVEINKKDHQYVGSVHNGNRARAFALSKLTLDEDAEILIKDQPYTLGNLVNAVTDNQSDILRSAYNETGQIEIGQFLYGQIISPVRNEKTLQFGKTDNLEVRLVTDDTYIARLPWAFLAENGVFQAYNGMSVSISSTTKTSDIDLPPAPRLLIIAPQVNGIEKTEADAHIQKLQQNLSAHAPSLTAKQSLQIVQTWEEFCKAVTEFQPEVVYFYGHGVMAGDTPQLVFSKGEKHSQDNVSVEEYVQQLRQMETPPALVYLNCCLGDGRSFIEAGKIAEELVPAVIVNRTKIPLDVAQEQALALWDRILLRGIAPHRAIATLSNHLGELDYTTVALRRMTPVVYAHYNVWRAQPLPPPSREKYDPYWHLKIDRVTQFSTVSAQTCLMVRERRPKSLAFAWYGEKGQGLEIFHKRLNVELREDLFANTYFYEVQPEWPMELADTSRSFSDMMVEAFQREHPEVKELADIPALIRKLTQGAAGRQTLVYVRHEPVTSQEVLNPLTLGEYLRWWDTKFIPLLQEHQFALLGISFVVKKPTAFFNALEEDQVEDTELKHTVFRVLDELEKLKRQHLIEFFRTHNIPLSIDDRDGKIEEILEKTGRNYEKTVEELKELISRNWAPKMDAPDTPEPKAEEFDY